MTPRVVFHPQARVELLEAQDWYERRVPGLGAEFIRTVDGAVATITKYPDGFGKVYGDFRQCALRRFPYSIVYRQRATDIVVIAVFHQRRDPHVWRKRPV